MLADIIKDLFIALSLNKEIINFCNSKDILLRENPASLVIDTNIKIFKTSDCLYRKYIFHILMLLQVSIEIK